MCEDHNLGNVDNEKASRDVFSLTCCSFLVRVSAYQLLVARSCCSVLGNVVIKDGQQIVAAASFYRIEKCCSALATWLPRCWKITRERLLEICDLSSRLGKALGVV